MSAIEAATSERVPESLETKARHIIEEACMVLPDIQALFGFQLIAVYNNRFSTALSASAMSNSASEKISPCQKDCYRKDGCAGWGQA